MEFVKKFTLSDFQAKNFTPSISPNFNSFSDKNTKISENGEIYTAGKNFTLPPAVTAWKNSTSGSDDLKKENKYSLMMPIWLFEEKKYVLQIWWFEERKEVISDDANNGRW